MKTSRVWRETEVELPDSKDLDVCIHCNKNVIMHLECICKNMHIVFCIAVHIVESLKKHGKGGEGERERHQNPVYVNY